MDEVTDPRRALPKVDVLLAHPRLAALAGERGRGPVLAAARASLAAAREAAAGGAAVPGLGELAERVVARVAGSAPAPLRAVVNATGVVLHTNLGRAPLGAAARAAVAEAAGYATVEFDLASGTRGRRGAAVAALLAQATGAAAGLAVNNAAGALLLALGALARGRQVVVSRGELIEIGGEFRLPDVMAAAGAELVEVGTTNRTRAADYARAIGPDTALLLAVHPSNYRISGFTASPALAELAGLAAGHGLPLVHDVGAGLLTGALGDEPTVAASLAAGASLVLFSGDKLLGGPQAGCVVGDAALVERLAADPLARALRADKLTLAALAATLAEHVAGRRDGLPTWRALTAAPEALRARAEAVLAALGPGAPVTIEPGAGVVGGGALPGHELPGAVLVVAEGAEAVLAGLRAGDPPVIGRIERDRAIVDLRTVPPEQDALVAAALAKALGAAGERARGA